MARDALMAVIFFALAAIVWRIERRIGVPRDCWRCCGVGQVQRWHRMTWKPCPRCGGTGQR